MLGRTRHSILLAQRGHLARADVSLSAAAQLPTVQRAARPAEDGLASLVEAAAGAERLQRSVWVLSDEVVVQSIELDARSVRGLSGDELTRALAYEAQKLTGLPASEAATAWRAFGADSGPGRSFLVTQMAQADLDDLAQIVKRLGGRLAGVCHPAGLPRRLGTGGTPGGAFRRLETWDEVRAEVIADGSDGVEVRILPAGERRGAREDLGEVAPTERLDATGGQAPRDAAVLRLDDEAFLARWLEAWARELSARAPGVPVLAPPVAPPSRVAVGAASLLVFGAVVALAWHDRAGLAEERAALGAQAAGLRDPIDRLARARADHAALRQELDELAQTASGGRYTGPRWAADLPARLMDVLATSRPAGLVVRDFDLSWQRGVVHGEALTPELVDRLAQPLAVALAGSGYDLAGAAKRRNERGLYDFEVTMVPLAGTPAAAAEDALR